MALDGEDATTAFLAVGKNRSSKIQPWKTADNGLTWAYTDVTGALQQQIRPHVPRNHDGEMRLLWPQGRYRSWGNRGWEMSLMASDSTSTPDADRPSVSVVDGGGTLAVGEMTKTISGGGSWDNVSLDDASDVGFDYGFLFNDSESWIEIDQFGLYHVTVSVPMDGYSSAGVAELQITNDRSVRRFIVDWGTVSSGD